MAGHRKTQPHPGAALPGAEIGGVLELDAAAMVFEHAADDREPEAGALLRASSHRAPAAAPGATLGRPMPLSITSITMSSSSRAAMTSIRPLPELLRRHLLDRFGGVLDDVGQRLRDQPPVELRAHRILLDIGHDIDLGMADLHQEHRLPHGVGDVLALHHGLRHPREAREFIDHPPDIVDLAHDGVGALLEDRLSLSSVMALPNLRRMRSAESWIGVSGFLISWAMRRATSPQAEVRCAETSSVMSSSVMM